MATCDICGAPIDCSNICVGCQEEPHCQDCGDRESDLTYCHACEKQICWECVGASDDESGSDFCRDCVAREGIEEEDEG